MADAWAHDIDAGHDTALLAWRRQDVADLNRLARERWDRLGHLHGDDIEVHPGRWYAPGDRLVALAPNHDVGIVTSEPLTVTDVTEGAMTVRTSEGRTATLTGDALDADHLDNGYATTIHRTQGATHDRTHFLAAGGGRELAYVALSRASEHSIVHATADDLSQAVDDLRTDWGAERAQRWITDTPARHGHEPKSVRAPLAASRKPEPQRSLPERQHQVRERLRSLEHDYDDLLAGTGRWSDTPAGTAARSLNDATDRLAEARAVASDPDARRGDRRAAGKALPQLEVNLRVARQVWGRVGAPEATRLEETIHTAQHQIVDLDRQVLDARLGRLQSGSASRPVGRGVGLGG